MESAGASSDLKDSMSKFPCAVRPIINPPEDTATEPEFDVEVYPDPEPPVVEEEPKGQPTVASRIKDWFVSIIKEDESA